MTPQKTLHLLLLATVAQGCVVYDSDDDTPPPPPPPPVNYAPFVGDAEAGCYWDDYYRDDIWYFDAAVNDDNGVYDVVEVWADVYDEYYNGGEYIESFELYPTDDPHVWFSDWMGHSTWLDCRYDGYSVDFVAYDELGEAGYLTVWAHTY
jgi:hypothetical protein